MIGLIGTAIGISIMARVATGVCRSIERSYPRNNNYHKPYQKRRYNNYNYRNKNTQPQQRPQQQNTRQQQLPLQHKQKQLQPHQKPRYNSFSYKPYKPKPVYDKNRKQPYWKLKVI